VQITKDLIAAQSFRRIVEAYGIANGKSSCGFDPNRVPGGKTGLVERMLQDRAAGNMPKWNAAMQYLGLTVSEADDLQDASVPVPVVKKERKYVLNETMP
jgi:hypothetical protein